MDDLLEQAEFIVAAIRTQNWKNGGCLSVDVDEANEAVKQLVRTAWSGGLLEGAQQMSESTMRAFDAATGTA